MLHSTCLRCHLVHLFTCPSQSHSLVSTMFSGRKSLECWFMRTTASHFMLYEKVPEAKGRQHMKSLITLMVFWREALSWRRKTKSKLRTAYLQLPVTYPLLASKPVCCKINGSARYFCFILTVYVPKDLLYPHPRLISKLNNVRLVDCSHELVGSQKVLTA